MRLSRAAAIEGLRRAWQDGVDSGGDADLDAEDVKQRGRERLAAMGRAKV
jgi:hypothetical protein